MVTIFKNLGDVNSPHRIELSKALERIRIGASKDKVEEIRRKAFSEEDYDREKKDLPFIEFSAANTKEVTSKKGFPTHREDQCVIEHSGVFILDFDKCDVVQKLEQLKKDPYILACWIAPSGTGVKGLVKCPASVENHSLYYTAFIDRYPELDTSSRNISRGTFESYDPNLWVNEVSLVWDKRMTEDQRRHNKDKEANRRGAKILSTAVAMVRSSYDGVKHESLRNAACLLGGYIATGRVDENEAVKVLEEEIRMKHPKDMTGALKTIRDGLDYGKSRPLHESKKIERAQEFLKREDGSYDFLADNEEMNEYELAVINGTLEMGLPTGINDLNNWWMFKKHHLVWFGGTDNVGKSLWVWYLAVLAAVFHDWKILIHSAENGDGQLRKKLKELFMNKPLKLMDDEELTIADDFVKKHFRIMSSKQMHTVEDMLLKAEIVYDEGFEFDVFIAEPYNSFDVAKDMDMHRHNLYALNRMRVFKENYSSIWVCDHVNSSAARNKDKDGYVEVPWKSDIEYGQLKANKVDDFIMIHRIINHPFKKYETQIHVHKVKDKETGGQPTQKDEPVIVQLNADYCGYSSNSVDPIFNYRKTLK